jgi:DNA-binding response OmpR family regulator
MGRVVFLTDRSPSEALPALTALDLDVKTEPLSAEGLADLRNLAPAIVIADAVENPDRSYRLLRQLGDDRSPVPVVVLLARGDLERFPWAEVADDLVYGSIPEAELRVRLDMFFRRLGRPDEATQRLGPLSLNTETYQVLVAGRVLDLTYKEFELLRFLMHSPGRVFSRSELLQRVWGYDFYGGTRTVDVHVRRLRAKLGPEHEGLIATVRGVGYAAAAVSETS